MNSNEYYAIYFKNKLVAVITEKELANLKEDKRKNKDISITRVAGNEISSFLTKDIKKILTREEREKLELELFIKEIVESIKGQLMTKPDMDIVIPEKAYNFIPQIENELKKEGIILKHPLRECINDISPYAKWEDKLKKDKEKARESFGRERE
jgi:hypothetical protein